MTLISLTIALWPNERANAIEKRIIEGGDRFFEEQRTYHSYPSLRSPRRIRIAGVVGVVGGLTICALQLFH